MNVELSVVIPCFNERGNAQQIIAQLAEAQAEAPCSTEWIFADGGSKDGTVDALREAITARGLSGVSVLQLPPGGGYGGDIMQGLAHARGRILAWTHADLQTDLRDVLEAYALYSAQERRDVFIKGKRRGRPALEEFFTFCMQLVAFAALRVYLSDINAQPKLFDRPFYETKLKGNAPSDFSLDLFAYYEARTSGYGILTIPVVFARRQHGEAKGGGGSWKNRLRLIRRTNKYIWHLRTRVKNA